MQTCGLAIFMVGLAIVIITLIVIYIKLDIATMVLYILLVEHDVLPSLKSMSMDVDAAWDVMDAMEFDPTPLAVADADDLVDSF